MKLKLTSVTLALACLMGLSGAATAGGFGADAGSLKDGIYDGVPVPAPRPLPIYNAQWYVRADFGYSIATDDNLSTTGFGFTPYASTDGQMALTLGMGRYLTPSLRAELAIDIRSEADLGRRNQDYVGTITEALLGPPASTDTHTFNVARQDQVRLASYTGMVNLYYDFNNRSRFTPYVGGGVGLAIHTMTRRYSETATCTTTTNSVTGGPIACRGTGLTTPTTANGTGAETGYGLAANAMVGTAYDMGAGWKLDLNYRYSWMSGNVKLVGTSLGSASTVQLGDVTEHALRAGVRMDIN